MNYMYLHADGVLFRHSQGPPSDVGQCTLQWVERGADESNKSDVRVQNACGVVLIESQVHSHRAWRKCRSIFGTVYKAYTLAGNLVLQRGRINFKGGLDCGTLGTVVRSLVCGDFRVQLQLMVLAVGLGMTLDVRVGCLLETRLRRLSWVTVMGRYEEVCNVVVFYVQSWRHLGGAARVGNPKSTTVSVTRRGTMTVRLTWDGVPWEGNGPYEVAVRELAAFVKALI